MQTQALLQALSSLSASSSAQETLRLDDLVWLGTTPSGIDGFSDPFGLLSIRNNSLSSPANGQLSVLGPSGAALPTSNKILEHLQLRSNLAGDQSIRATWLVAVRNRPSETNSQQPRRVGLPLLQTRIELGNPPATLRPFSNLRTLPFSNSWTLRQATDWNLGVDIEDESAAEQVLNAAFSTSESASLEEGSHSTAMEEVHHWIRLLAAAIGWELDQITEAHPASIEPVEDRVTVCIGLGLIAPSPTSSFTQRAAVGRWASVEGIDETAFNSIAFPHVREHSTGLAAGQAAEPLEGPAGHSALIATHDSDVHSIATFEGLLPLSAAQRMIALSAATEPVTAVSGAPGTGKTHTLCAAICNAIAAGQSVLVATRSTEAAEVIAAQLGKQPGPPALRFGSPDALKSAISELDRRLTAPTQDLHAGDSKLEVQLEARTLEVQTLHARALELLAVVEAVETYLTDPEIIGAFREEFPPLFAPNADLERFTKTLNTARSVEGNWWVRQRRRVAIRRLNKRLSTPLKTDNEPHLARRLRHIGEAIAAAEASRSKPQLTEIGEELRRTLPRWFEATASLRLLRGQLLDQELLEQARSSSGRQVVSALSTALRSGAASRGKLIDTLNPQELLQAAPLWLGTLGEIERLLPKIAGLFDLVVVDEASQVELAVAAPGLLRAKRALIAGDPQQLRFVSFLSSEATHSAFAQADLLEHVARLDPARNSVFDLAASAAPVQWLDEHYRSAPHLIGFSAEHFYSNPLHLVTQSPHNLTLDCIHTHLVADNQSAIAEAIERTRALHREGVQSIGIISPFRDIVDQLTETALTDLSPELLADTNLMIATTHGFQGAERSHVLIVVGIDHTSPPGRARFLENANLFNVLVTRARNEIDVFATEVSEPSSLIGRYLTWARTPLDMRLSAAAARNATAETFGQACRFGGASVTNSFPVGRHAVDVVLEYETNVIGVLCGTHPDGATAHLDRYAMLRQAGWDVVDLIPPDDPEQVVKLSAEITSRPRS